MAARNLAQEERKETFERVKKKIGCLEALVT
jgi:hypothetical protein